MTADFVSKEAIAGRPLCGKKATASEERSAPLIATLPIPCRGLPANAYLTKAFLPKAVILDSEPANLNTPKPHFTAVVFKQDSAATVFTEIR